MDSNNLNVLVEAKKEYLSQLCIILCPIMVDTFERMYNQVTTKSKGKLVLKSYQTALKEIPEWNNHTIHEHVSAITDSCSWFSDLLAAVFVSYVKILSSVRLTSNTKKISIKLTQTDVFIHKCFITAAKDLYKDPYIMYEEKNEYKRHEKLTERFMISIENTIKELIPVQTILQTYITKNSDDGDVDVDNEVVDSEDPDIVDDYDMPDSPESEVVEETDVSEPQEPQEPQEAQEPQEPQEVQDPQEVQEVQDPQEVQEVQEVQETKNISLDGKIDDDVLFPDAPDA